MRLSTPGQQGQNVAAISTHIVDIGSGQLYGQGMPWASVMMWWCLLPSLLGRQDVLADGDSAMLTSLAIVLLPFPWANR